MQCIILCAGFATRLRPLTLDQPKHLLPIAGRPMLDYQLDRLAASGITSGVVVTNGKFIDNFRRWADSGEHAIDVTVLDDGTTTNETRLGAIGDLQYALEKQDVQEDFIVVNGDNLFTFPLEPAVKTFQTRGNSIVVYDVGSLEVSKLMGHAATDGDGRVTDFIEKPENPTSSMISIGIYIYRKDVRNLVRKYIDDGHPPDRTGDFVRWLHTETPVFVHEVKGDAGTWFDIGSWDQYQEANAAYGGEPIPMPEEGESV